MIATLASLLITAHAQAPPAAEAESQMRERIESARADISDAEKRQREMLSHLFVLNKKIRESANTRAKLARRQLEREGKVRALAQDVAALEEKSEHHQELLNGRLRHLYQHRGLSSMQWLFSAGSPIELERQHRYMRKMVDSDHRQLRGYLTHLRELRERRERLKAMVAGLARTQREVQREEAFLAAQLREKSRVVSELKQSKDLKLGELKEMREQAGGADPLSYAFFERRGSLRPPVEARIAREYGTYVDPQFRFRIMHKGLFYTVPARVPVKAVAEGTVVLSATLPGYGRTVIVDHGDNYYSVYALNAELKVGEGKRVSEGDTLGVSGVSSPLFGPGVYFEIRHFTDAIDPRGWIKDAVMKTASQ